MDIDNLMLKFRGRGKRHTHAHTTTVKDMHKVGGLTLPKFNTSYKATVTQTMWYWQKNRQINRRDRIKNPEIDPYKYS